MNCTSVKFYDNDTRTVFISKIIDTNMDKQNLNYLNFVSVPDVNGCQCCLNSDE